CDRNKKRNIDGYRQCQQQPSDGELDGTRSFLERYTHGHALTHLADLRQPDGGHEQRRSKCYTLEFRQRGIEYFQLRHHRRLWPGEQLRLEPGRRVELRDQCDVHAHSGRDKKWNVDNHRQRQQQPSDRQPLRDRCDCNRLRAGFCSNPEQHWCERRRYHLILGTHCDPTRLSFLLFLLLVLLRPGQLCGCRVRWLGLTACRSRMTTHQQAL